jgi:integrase
MARSLGIKTTLHKLRHYSATELIAAGVDIRTIAGRLGHGGGGTTTLRVYAAWVSEADQRAAQVLGGRLRGLSRERPGRP